MNIRALIALIIVSVSTYGFTPPDRSLSPAEQWDQLVAHRIMNFRRAQEIHDDIIKLDNETSSCKSQITALQNQANTLNYDLPQALNACSNAQAKTAAGRI